MKTAKYVSISDGILWWACQLFFFTWMQPELNIFKGLDLGNIFATAIMIGLTCVIVWKYYDERGRK